jgi:uncharacterized membrane-anchored protein YjiN (DUF445 family)
MERLFTLPILWNYLLENTLTTFDCIKYTPIFRKMQETNKEIKRYIDEMYLKLFIKRKNSIYANCYLIYGIIFEKQRDINKDIYAYKKHNIDKDYRRNISDYVGQIYNGLKNKFECDYLSNYIILSFDEFIDKYITNSEHTKYFIEDQKFVNC